MSVKSASTPNYQAVVNAFQLMTELRDWEIDKTNRLWAVTSDGMRIHPLSALAGWLLDRPAILCPARPTMEALGLNRVDLDRIMSAIDHTNSHAGLTFIKDAFPLEGATQLTLAGV